MWELVMKIKIINGPNLNMLGLREPEIYGSDTLSGINEEIMRFAKEKDIEVSFFQSNSEGDIVGEIQKAYFDKYDGIVLNAGAYTHTSLAICDAVRAVPVSVVEVHLSNIYGRESVRQKSLIAPYCKGQICGFGKNVYIMALFSFIL